MTDETADRIRRLVLLVVGAAIIIFETVTPGDAKPAVIVIALILVGVVTVEQAVTWLTARRPRKMPVAGLQRPQEPPTPIRPPEGPDDAA